MHRGLINEFAAMHIRILKGDLKRQAKDGRKGVTKYWALWQVMRVNGTLAVEESPHRWIKLEINRQVRSVLWRS